MVKDEKHGRPAERVLGLRIVTDVGYGLVSNCGGGTLMMVVNNIPKRNAN
jgi:hypothetical protein